MNKYVYSECNPDTFPELNTIVARSYNDAVERLLERFIRRYEDDDEIASISSFDELQEYLNEQYTVVISDLVDVEDL